MRPPDFDHLKKLHAKLEQKAEQEDQEGYIEVNNQFHSYVQELAGNRSLNQILGGLRKKILLYRFQSLHAQGRMAESIREHRELLEVFHQRDHLKVEMLMQIHLKKQLAALEEQVQNLETAGEALS